jgi:hypothetical protein
MKPVHIPRTLIILSVLLIALTFLVGVLHAFRSARAAPPTSAAIASRPAETELTPTPAPTPVLVSGDTTGIIALAMLIVTIVLVGAIIGGNTLLKKKTP